MDAEQEASLMGWMPQDQFKGDPAKWTSAQEFVDRGKHLMPILRKNNERLVGEIEGLKTQVNQLNASLSESSGAMKDLMKFHEESTKAQVAKARADLLAELKEAKTEGDVDAEIEAQSKLSEFDAAQKAVVAPTAKTAPATEQVSPEVKQWMTENPWYGVDQERTGLAMGVAQRLRAQGTTLVGRAFLEQVAITVAERLGEGETAPRNSKVEGGGRGADVRGGTGYAGLPSDAKAQCDKDAGKFVGPNKAFKTAKEWNTYFADQYFKGN
jgi:hypothetical protein